MTGCFIALAASIIGFIIAGPFGAIIAYIIVSLFTFGRGGASTAGINRDDLVEYLTDIMMLFSYIASSDGKVSRNEVEYVKQFLTASFPDDPELVRELIEKFRLFNENPSEINLENAAYGINRRAEYSRKIALFSMLVNLSVHSLQPEQTFKALTQIGRMLNLSEYDIISLLSYYSRRSPQYERAGYDYYGVLGVDRNATDQEVKRRYKELVKIYHPDKLINMPESFRKDAEDKFKMVNEAYKEIKRERGFS